MLISLSCRPLEGFLRNLYSESVLNIVLHRQSMIASLPGRPSLIILIQVLAQLSLRLPADRRKTSGCRTLEDLSSSRFWCVLPRNDSSLRLVHLTNKISPQPVCHLTTPLSTYQHFILVLNLNPNSNFHPSIKISIDTTDFLKEKS